jgi:riboflavin kinase
MRAKVVRGFGRGSAEMGLPTANLDPAEISLNWQEELNDDTVDVKNIPLGVYFGYCQLEGDESGKKNSRLKRRSTPFVRRQEKLRKRRHG